MSYTANILLTATITSDLRILQVFTRQDSRSSSDDRHPWVSPRNIYIHTRTAHEQELVKVLPASFQFLDIFSGSCVHFLKMIMVQSKMAVSPIGSLPFIFTEP